METDTEQFERHTRVNQLGCFFLGMKTVVPLMEQSGGVVSRDRPRQRSLATSSGAARRIVSITQRWAWKNDSVRTFDRSRALVLSLSPPMKPCPAPG